MIWNHLKYFNARQRRKYSLKDTKFICKHSPNYVLQHKTRTAVSDDGSSLAKYISGEHGLWTTRL